MIQRTAEGSTAQVGHRDGLLQAKLAHQLVQPERALIAPGVVAAALLTFALSLDDFIITNFVKGAGMETLPTAIFGSVKQGIKPNIMAISTMMLAVSVLFVTLSYLANRIGQRTRS